MFVQLQSWFLGVVGVFAGWHLAIVDGSLNRSHPHSRSLWWRGLMLVPMFVVPTESVRWLRQQLHVYPWAGQRELILVQGGFALCHVCIVWSFRHEVWNLSTDQAVWRLALFGTCQQPACCQREQCTCCWLSLKLAVCADRKRSACCCCLTGAVPLNPV